MKDKNETTINLFNTAAERIAFLEEQHELLMEKIQMLRAYEDEDCTESEALSAILLGLNEICGN